VAVHRCRPRLGHESQRLNRHHEALRGQCVSSGLSTGRFLDMKIAINCPFVARGEAQPVTCGLMQLQNPESHRDVGHHRERHETCSLRRCTQIIGSKFISELVCASEMDCSMQYWRLRPSRTPTLSDQSQLSVCRAMFVSEFECI
jgi:hypothetical protein